MTFSRLVKFIGQQRDKVIEYQTRMTELPALGPENGGTGEMPKALYLEGLLRELGVTDILRIDAPDPRVPDGVRPNVVARIPGASPRRLWILGHMDVVPPGELSYWKTDPWKVVVDGDKIRGRGVEDNQQAIVCGLLIAQELKAQGITPDLSLGLIFVSDEETQPLRHPTSSRPTPICLAPTISWSCPITAWRMVPPSKFPRKASCGCASRCLGISATRPARRKAATRWSPPPI
ncbi:MAG: M20/M25/M40 family metallo-hydrolase [Bilophila wadsworthia]